MPIIIGYFFEDVQRMSMILLLVYL